MSNEPPPLPRTPKDALGPTIEETVILGEQRFTLLRPGESDRLLDHPFVQSAFAVDEYLPYWADLWPAARMLAKAILKQDWPPGLTALEVGCGLGLPGIAALSRGLHVIFSDYDATALDFAADNARANGFEQGEGPGKFELLPFDWRRPPEGLRVPVVLGSDLIYEVRNVAPLVQLIGTVLAPGGVCLLTDQDRVPSQVLRQTLEESGLAFTTQMVRAGEPGHRRIKGTLYRITHPGQGPPLIRGPQALP
jgi:predicted nicotinamide N-methyase